MQTKIKLKSSLRTGIVLYQSSWKSEKFIRKYSISYDDEVKIERLIESEFTLGQKNSDEIYFNRLIRDIQSDDENTRELASDILYQFLEFDIELFDLKILKNGIEKIINQIKIETNYGAERNLVYGLFEFIWWEKITHDEKVNLLERLTEIDSFYLWSFLEDELEEDLQKLNSLKLNEYFRINQPKWNDHHE